MADMDFMNVLKVAAKQSNDGVSVSGGGRGRCVSGRQQLSVRVGGGGKCATVEVRLSRVL